jgi:hypothetical protein
MLAECCCPAEVAEKRKTYWPARLRLTRRAIAAGRRWRPAARRCGGGGGGKDVAEEDEELPKKFRRRKKERMVIVVVVMVMAVMGVGRR